MARKYRPLLCARILAVVAIALMATSVFGAQVPTDAPTGRILVKFRSGANASEVARLHAAHNAVVADVIPGIQVTRLNVPPGQEKASVEDYRHSPSVEFAEVDSVLETQFAPNDIYYTTAYQTTRYGKIAQWAPQYVSAPSAWNTTQGDPAIIIAIVDTGVDTGHPDLNGKIVSAVSLIGQGVKDDFGHGTHVAGIAAAETNNSLGIAGICPLCSIMSIKVLDKNGSGFWSDVAAGIVYAADKGARIINLSLGGPGSSQTLRAAIDYAFAHNALPVAAMGNGYAPEALQPAYWYSALSVGAVDQSGAKADFSNYGPKTDVVAPGVAILSTLPTYPVTLTQTYEQDYDALSGTSMATPIVSGIAGLVLSRNPALSASEVKGIIEATAGDGKSFTDTTGFGLVNAAKAVVAAAQTDTTPPSVNVVSPAPASVVSKVFTLQAAPADDMGVHHVDFVIEGTRASAPGTGGGKRGTTAWTTQWESTRYWNGPQTVTAVAFDMNGNSTSQDVPFAILNTYKTVTWTAHLCNPPTAPCPYYILNPVTPAYAAAAHLQVNWTYTRSDNYSNATFWATSFNGWLQDLTFTQGSSIDFYPDDRLCGCNKNQVGAGMAGWVKKNGGAEADVRITLTYPE